MIFLCLAIAVHDGDTFTCSDRRVVRLAGVDAAEIGPCRKGRICANGDPYAARDALSRAVQGRTLRCEVTGHSYRRTVAWCQAPDEAPLSCQMLTAGRAELKIHFWPKGKSCP